jgi:hypothetical protein
MEKAIRQGKSSSAWEADFTLLGWPSPGGLAGCKK